MSATERKQWIITEHRQIVLEAATPLSQGDAMRCALDPKFASYIVSDHTKRNIYPMPNGAVENTDKRTGS